MSSVNSGALSCIIRQDMDDLMPFGYDCCQTELSATFWSGYKMLSWTKSVINSTLPLLIGQIEDHLMSFVEVRSLEVKGQEVKGQIFYSLQVWYYDEQMISIWLKTSCQRGHEEQRTTL